MNREQLKELAKNELGMYDLTEILDDTVLDFFYKYLAKYSYASCNVCRYAYSQDCPVTGLNNMYSRFSCSVFRIADNND